MCSMKKGLHNVAGVVCLEKIKITPLVGDQVVFQADNPSEGYVLEVFDRKNELVRSPIANVDQAILVFSAVEPDFNPGLLDRFLVLIEYHNIKPIICISKMDLVDEKMRETVESYANDYREMGYDVLFTSINTSESIDI